MEYDMYDTFEEPEIFEEYVFELEYDFFEEPEYVYAIIVNPQCIHTMIMNKTPPLLRPNPRSFHIVAESIGNSDVLLVNRNS